MATLHDSSAASGRSAELPSAFSLDELDAENLRHVAAANHVPVGKRASKESLLSALRERLSDGEFWDAVLAELPELCLLMLEALCELGGGLDGDQLLDLVAGRAGVSRPLVQSALDRLRERNLVARLTVAGYRDKSIICLFAECAEPLCARVRGASLPEPPADLDGSAARAADERGLRDALVLAALTAHRRLRFTARNDPDRSTLRTFVKGLGSREDEVFDRLIEARSMNLLGARSDRMIPRAEELLAVARRGGHISHPQAYAWIGSDWISSDAYARAALRAQLEPQLVRSSRALLGMIAADSAGRLSDLRRRIAHAGPCDRAARDGIDWLRRPAHADRPRGGDGHVTASFEVLLGPAADLETCCTVALGAELQRIDHVLTLRLTPRSVTAGISCGLDPEQLLASLDGVGRHPVPENVAKLVREWTQTVRPARVQRGCFVFVDPPTERALQQGPLAPFVLDTPAPGALQMAPHTPRELLEQELSRAGWTWSPTYGFDEARELAEIGTLDPDEDPGDLDAPVEPAALELPWTLAPGGTRAVRERIVAGRARGFTLPERTSSGAGGGTKSSPSDALGTLLRRLSRECSNELARFRTRLAREDRARLDEALEELEPLAPFLALRSKWRRRALQQSTDLDDLIECSVHLMHAAPMRVSEEGSAALDLIVQRTLSGELEQAPQAQGRARPSRRAPPAKLPAAHSREDIEARLAQAVESASEIRLITVRNGAHEVLHVMAERIVRRGMDRALLGEDLDAGDLRVIPLRDIHSVELV